MSCTDHTRIGRQDVGLRPSNLRSRHVRHAVCRPVRHHGLRLHQGNHNNDSTSNPHPLRLFEREIGSLM
jgi:hypothetical protein